jgi:methionine-rich copper-binding protein CopC
MKRIGLILASLLLIWASAPSAQAHTELESTSPTAAEQVVAPQQITLTFNEAPILEGSSIVLADANGTQYTSEPLALEGNTLVGDWPADLPVGDTTVYWRAVSDDGHVITGDYNFYYSAAAAAQSVITDGSVSATPEPRTLVAETSDKSSATGVAVVAAIGALVALALFFILRNRRNK